MGSSRVRRAVVICIAVLGVAAALTACRHPEDVQGRKIMVVGDSLLKQAEAPVQSALQSDGWEATVTGVPGSTIEQWRDLVGALADKVGPDVAVVELGTNNCAKGACEDVSAYIDAVMHQLSKHASVVYWLNTRTVPAVHPVHPDYLNREIADSVSRWPNLVVVDMHAWQQEHPEWILADGLHFTDAGEVAFAQLVRDAVHANSPAAAGGSGS